MFTVAFVHREKNPDYGKSSNFSNRNRSLWEPFTPDDLEKLYHSPLWSTPCDVSIPVYAEGGDYCPLCTRSGEFEIISNIFDWGQCKDCFETDKFEVPNCESGFRGYTVVSEALGRPVIFSFINKKDYITNKCIDEAEKHLNVIHATHNSKKEYTKKYRDESPEALEKWQERYEKASKKSLEERRLESERIIQDMSTAGPVTHYARDESGDMIQTTDLKEFSYEEQLINCLERESKR